MKDNICLDDSLCFGAGANRKCYVHPHNAGLCIKIPFKKDTKRDGHLREIYYFELYQRRNISLRSLPKYHGKISTNLGPGYVFDLIRDFDGEISKTLKQWLLEGIDKNLLEEEIVAFYQSLKSGMISVSDLKSANIVVCFANKNQFSLILIDGIGNTEFIKFADKFQFFYQRKLLRKFSRLLKKLDYPLYLLS